MRRWFYILVSGLLLVQTAFGAVPNSGSQVQPQNEIDAQAAQYNNDGVQLANQERFREAIRAFQKAVALVPDFASAHYNMGLSFVRLQQFRDATQAFRAAVQSQPTYGDAWYQLGISLQAQHDFEGASKAYELALSRMPDSPTLLYRLGYVFLNLQNWPQAVMYWEQLTKEYPDHPAALSLQPYLPNLYFNLGTVRYSEHDLVGAEKALDLAVRLQPGFHEARYNLGLVYLAQEQYVRAIKTLRDVVTDQPNNLDVLLSLGKAYSASDSLAQAEKVLRNALNQWPNEMAIYRNLTDVLVRQGNIPEALADALTVVANAPQNPDGFKALAHVYEHNLQGERYGNGFAAEKAIRAYEHAIALDSTDVATHFNLGVIYGRLGDWAQAWQAFKRAQKIDPTYEGVVKWLPVVEARYEELQNKK